MSIFLKFCSTNIGRYLRRNSNLRVLRYVFLNPVLVISLICRKKRDTPLKITKNVACFDVKARTLTKHNKYLTIGIPSTPKLCVTETLTQDRWKRRLVPYDTASFRMNRSDGGRFHARGPIAGHGRSRGFPHARGHPAPPRSMGFPGRMPPGRGGGVHPPLMDGRMHFPGSYPTNGISFPMQPGVPPPPPMMGGRPPPPPPPPPPPLPLGIMNHSMQLSRGIGHGGSLSHLDPLQSQVRNAHHPPIGMNHSIGGVPNPTHILPLQPQHTMMNAVSSRFHPLSSQHARLNAHHPPTPQSTYNQPKGYGLVQQPPTMMQTSTSSSSHDPRLRAPNSLQNNLYSQHMQHPAAQPQNSHLPASSDMAQSTSIANPTAYSQKQLDDAWSHHVAPNGTIYYYNNILQTSTYDKPEVLKADELAKGAVSSNEGQSSMPWKKYTDANTGKHYYSNGTATTWEKPDGFEDADANTESAPDEPPKKKKKESKAEISFSNKEEAVAAFKGLLLAKEVSPSSKWNDLIKLCSSDPKWDACETALTTGERKQALAEYQTKRANDLRANERQEKIRTREAFLQLLSDKVGDIKDFSPWTTSFVQIRESLAKDDRFHAVENDTTRESLFLDFCEEFKKREERRKRNKKREAQEAFDAFLHEKEETGLLTYASTWNSFVASLEEKDRKDTRFDTSPFISDSDRQLFFADFVIKLQQVEDDRRNRIRGARHRAEKAQREDFVNSLRSLSETGKIVPSTSWRSVEALITSLPTYGPVFDQDIEAPRDMFEDFVSEWSETYRRDRSLLCQLVFPSIGEAIVVNPHTVLKEFSQALLDAAEASPDLYRETRRIINRSHPVSSAQLYLEELVAASKEAQAADFPRRPSIARRWAENDSEDEGEIEE